MNAYLIVMLALTAAAAQKPAIRTSMLADADARPKMAVTAAAKPMRLVEEPPAKPGDMMQQDLEKPSLQPAGTAKPAPFPDEPRPPSSPSS